MKNSIFVIFIMLFLTSCSEQDKKVPVGRFTLDGTQISLTIPDKWHQTKIISSNYPTIYTEIHYGIKPNIQLEKYAQNGVKQSILSSYIKQKKKLYPDYTILEESNLKPPTGENITKIKAKRMNSEGIPIIYFSYIFNQNNNVSIISATCAEPSVGIFGGIFDQIMQSVEITN